MKLLWILFFLIVQSLLSGLTNGRIINGFNLRSFACLGISSTSQERCKVLGVVAVLPDRLLTLYKNQIAKVRNALDIGNLTSLKEHELASLDPILFLLIPENELAQIGGQKLAALLNYWPHDKIIARHILSAVLFNENLNDFLQQVRTMIIDNDILDMIGEELPLDADSVLGPLLTHLPFQKVLNLTQEQKQKMLITFKLYVNIDEYHWSSKKSVSQRIWSSLLLEEKYPMPLHFWKDSDVQTTGSILIGALPSELRLIQGKNIYDKNQLFTWDFNTLQVRALFETLYENIDLSTLDFRSLKMVLVKLLPSQLQRFSNTMTNFRRLLESPHPKSIATSKQIVEFLLREGRYHILHRRNEFKDSIVNVGRMVYVLPLSTLQVYRNNSLNIKQLIPLQSDKLSLSQVYYILGAGANINVSSASFHEMSSFLHAMPTSYVHKSLDPYLISHLALHLPFENLPRLMKFLQFSSSALGSSKIFISILEHPERLQIFDYFPHRILQKDGKLLIQILKIVPTRLFSSFSSLPNKLAPFILRNLDETSMKSSLSLKNNLILGLTCQDFFNLSSADFIVVMSRYRRTLKKINKEFPKELQYCTARKLIEYLKLKSYVRQQFLDDHFMSLLSPVEIEAVGGWVLSSLPLEDIISSPHLKTIVRQIGSMSVSEILAAAPLTKIRRIIYNFLVFQETKNEVNAEDLFFFGNLTMLLKDDIINKIDRKAFRMLLEGRFLDTRICANAAERHAWFQLILDAFGSINDWTGEEIKILGNLLISLPKNVLKKIPQKAWIQVADVLEFGYLDEVQQYRDNTFLKLCQSLLPTEESDSYLSSIQLVLEFFLQAAQFQLNTVKKLDDVSSLKETDLKKFKEEEADNSDEDEMDDIVIIQNENSPNLIKEVLSITESNLLDSNYSVTEINISSDNNLSKENVTVTDDLMDDNNYEVSPPEDETFTIKNSTKINNDSFNIQLDEQKVFEKVVSEMEAEDPKTLPVTHIPIANDSLPEVTQKISEINDSAFDQDLQNYNGSIKVENSIAPQNETVLMPVLLENQTYVNGQNLEGIAIFPDYLTALEALENTSPSTNESKYVHSDDLLHSLRNSDNIFQPVNVTGMFQLSPSKVKLQDMLLSPNIIVYENLTHALQSSRHASEIIKPFEDSMHLEPAMDSEEWNTKFMEKRSAKHELEEVSCDAMKMIGTGIQLILSKDIISRMSDQELFDCSEIFSSVQLPEATQGIIWSRLNKMDFHLKGHLLASAKVKDLLSYNFNLSQPWVLETIFELSRFNFNPNVVKYIVEKAFSNENVLRVEEVVSLGKFICNLPSLKDVLRPSVLLKTSVVLGSSLTCNVHCLNILASIATEDDAFGLSIHWSSLDFADLGIIVAGLSTGNWVELMKTNPNVLYGLQTSAAECLSFEHIEAIPKEEIFKIPHHSQSAIKERLKTTDLEESKQAFLEAEYVQTRDSSSETSHSISKSINNTFVVFVLIIQFALCCIFN